MSWNIAKVQMKCRSACFQCWTTTALAVWGNRVTLSPSAEKSASPSHSLFLSLYNPCFTDLPLALVPCETNLPGIRCLLPLCFSIAGGGRGDRAGTVSTVSTLVFRVHVEAKTRHIWNKTPWHLLTVVILLSTATAPHKWSNVPQTISSP